MVFLGLCAASGWFVFRRAGEAGPTFFGALIGGFLLSVSAGWLTSIPGRIADWMRIVSARFGSEPGDGKRVALIGTLRAQGELIAPFSRERCALYVYEITTVLRSGKNSSIHKAYEGFAMVPLAVEHGTERTRILAKPKLELKPESLNMTLARDHAKTFVEQTEFVPATKDEKDLTHSSGALRYDYFREPRQENLVASTLQENLLRAESNVCVLGTYNADRRALIAPVTLRTGSAFAIGAAWRVVNAVIGMVIFAALALVSAAIFCVNYPLDAAEHQRPDMKVAWWEIDVERFVHQRLRVPMHQAGMISTPGFYLQPLCDGCAKGRLEIEGRTIELKHAAYTGERTVHLSATPGHGDGVTLAGRRVILTIDGKAAPVPQSWLQENDIETSLSSEGEYAGRITVVAPDGWIRCRVYFNVSSLGAAAP